MITVRNDNTSFVVQDYTTYNNIRVGLLNGNLRNTDFADFARKKNFSYTPVYFDMIPDMEEALQSCKIDAIVSSSMRAINNERIIEKFAKEDIYIITDIGISEEFIKKIFKEFTQENDDARTQYCGTGLGMAIVKKQIEIMGGTISVQSKKNVGTTFQTVDKKLGVGCYAQHHFSFKTSFLFIFFKINKNLTVFQPRFSRIFASFFKFMHAKVSPAFISIRAFPTYCVYRNPCCSFAVPKIRSMVSFLNW